MSDTPRFQEALVYLVHVLPGVGRTKLMKLLFLADVESYKTRGRSLTGETYLSYDHGPWTRGLYRALESAPEIDERMSVTRFGDAKYAYRSAAEEYVRTHLTQEDVRVLDHVVERWGNRQLRSILDHVYSSPPYAGTPFGVEVDFSRLDEA